MASTSDGGSVPRPGGFTAPGGEFGFRLQQLAHVTAEFAEVETLEAVVDVVTARVPEAVRASIAALMVREADRLKIVGSVGLQPSSARRWASFAADDDTPASEALRTGEPVVVANGDEVARRYPGIREKTPALRSVVCLPLNAGQKPLGVLGLTFDGGWTPGPRELDFLTTLAGACAQALRRIQTAQAAEEKAVQLAFLAEASAELSSSLDFRATLTKVARLAVRTLADWCAVDTIHDGVLTTLAVEHVDAAKVALARQLQERYPPDPDAATGAPNVIRTGRSELYPLITDDMLVARARDADHLRLSRELNLLSALVVPLSAHGRTLGAITFVRAETRQLYTPADLLVAENLGSRAGVAMDNAQLHGQVLNIALELQRAVLPTSLDHFPGWQIATHYRPGGHADVGGDFYGATALPDGTLAVFIGDVMGHGVPAAAAMAQMRAAIRAYLCIDPDPAVVVTKLDRMFDLLQLSQLVSLVYAVVDPDAGQLRLTNAGHCPPLLVRPDGRIQFLEDRPSRILGAGGETRHATTWPFADRDTLTLYTDGLIERRGEGISTGLERLAGHAGALVGSPLQQALDRVADRVADDAGADDVTAIAIRAQPR